jgi:hypothetical protein
VLNSKHEIRNSKWLQISQIAVGLLAAFWLILAPAAVNAQFDPLKQACAENNTSPACTDSAAVQENNVNPITDTINDAANIIAIATAVIAVIVIIIAGITLVLSSGEAASVKSARDAIIFAAVGMVVVALARTIVVFIVNRI